MPGQSARTLKLTLAYDGTPYVGWQRQSSGVSIQALLEDALARVEGGPVRVVGAGRTDAGVHALGQVASVRMTHPIETPVLQRALNATLPAEIRVLDVQETPASFHARYDARAKTYHYAIANGPFASPFDARCMWLVPQPLDLGRMADAAARLEGRHDFAAFQSAGSAVRTTTRTLTASIFRLARPGEPAWATPALPGHRGPARWLYEVSGDGFLRQMVRAIAGTLVEIGAGRRPVDDVDRILASRSRLDAGPTAPPHGLCLMSVAYDEDESYGS